MKRIGLLSLALVLALGTLGVGYAAWYQTVEITQTVETGSLCLKLDGEADIKGDKKGYAGVEVIKGDDDLSVTIAVTGLFPCVTVEEKFIITACGTIPVHMTAEYAISGDGDLFGYLTWDWEITVENDAGVVVVGSGFGDFLDEWDKIIEILEDTKLVQLHKGYVLVISGDKAVKQVDEAQGLDATFTLTVVGTQYNYPKD